jgi:hypothetical protein
MATKGLRAIASRKAVDAEAQAKDAAGKAAEAKDRLARLAKGEDEFDAFEELMREETSIRWKILRQIRAMRGR